MVNIDFTHHQDQRCVYKHDDSVPVLQYIFYLCHDILSTTQKIYFDRLDHPKGAKIKTWWYLAAVAVVALLLLLLV